MRVIESREIFINVYLTNKDIPTHLLLFCKLMFTQLLSQHPFFFFFFYSKEVSNFSSYIRKMKCKRQNFLVQFPQFFVRTLR